MAMTAIREDILKLRSNGIALVAYEGLGEPDIIPLWFGETDLVTPSFIRDAAKRALDDGKTFYVHCRGIAPLREAIANFHARMLDTKVAFERITVPGSAMLSVIAALQCVAGKSDSVVIVSPIWPNIFQAADVVGARPILVPLDADWSHLKPRWHLDLDKLFDACNASTKAIFISSPGNPTGWMMSREEQRTVLAFAREHGIAIISDEVYGALTYDGLNHAPSFLELATPDDEVFVVNSFSKSWAMTGWRVGWLVHPRALDEAMNVISVVDNSGATSFAQHGALAALSKEGDEFLASMRERCANGRAVVQEFIDGQNSIRWIPPAGAFYGFLHLESLDNSLEFARQLVREKRVGVAPGSAFGSDGDAQNEAFLRICFALEPSKLKEGLARIGQALASV